MEAVSNYLCIAAFALMAVPTARAAARGSSAISTYQFSSGVLAPRAERVGPDERYSDQRGFGFESGTVPHLTRDGTAITASQPFYFSVKLPDGNYNVTVTFGDTAAGSQNSVKAEDRRLMLKSVITQPGQVVTRRFTVNIRTPQISGGGLVHLKEREIGPPLEKDWDDRLTLEFNGKQPAVQAVEVEPAQHATTVYLLGDSTVTDQPDEPWCSWGQMLPRFFRAGIAIANNANSGETLRRFMGSNRLAKVLSTMQPGDYAFIQFGHNDQKEHGPGIGPFTSYKHDLEYFITQIRHRGGHPVLVTSMNRRRFNSAGKIVNTLGDYPAAVRLTAAQQHVPLIDLNAMSKVLFNELGPQGTLHAFVHYPANTFPNQPKPLKDDSHFNGYGAYELAKCVVQAIIEARLPITSLLKDQNFHFDPSHPDPFSAYHIPPSLSISEVKPAGS